MFMGFQSTPDSMLTNREYITSVNGLDKSLMGMESRGGGGGGGGGLTQQQKDYQKNKWQFDFQQMSDAWDYKDDSRIVAMKNEELTRNHKNAVETRKWVNEEKMRIFDFNQKVEAYNASVKAFEAQLDYNALAAQITANDNTRKYNERLTDIGFKNEERIMNLGFKKRDLTNKFGSAKAGLTQKAQGALLEGMQKQGQVLAAGQTGRSARKNLQAVLAQQGAAQGYLVDQLLREETGYDFALEQNEATSSFSERQLQESMKSARGQWEADKQQIALQKYSADMQAENNVMGKPVEQPQLEPPLDIPSPNYGVMPKKVTKEQWDKLKPPEDVKSGGGGGGGIMGAIGMGLQVASIFAGGSDDRFKYNLNRVGTSPSGIPKYTFKYRLDGPHGPTWTGTSAQDLLAMGRGDAVFQKEKDGFYYVDYSKLDVDMEIVTT